MSHTSTDKKPELNELSHCFETAIRACGEDPNREGLQKTPRRAAQAFLDLTKGYSINIEELVNHALFNSQNDAMVVVKNIEFHSLCEHHLLPFSGTVHVGYLPKNKVIGLSKIPRIVDAYARRLQIQERLCYEVAQCLEHYTQALGVGVIVHAKHSCISMRGIEKQCASLTTSAMLGQFRSSDKTRNEFLMMIK